MDYSLPVTQVEISLLKATVHPVLIHVQNIWASETNLNRKSQLIFFFLNANSLDQPCTSSALDILKLSTV